MAHHDVRDDHSIWVKGVVSIVIMMSKYVINSRTVLDKQTPKQIIEDNASNACYGMT